MLYVAMTKHQRIYLPEVMIEESEEEFEETEDKEEKMETIIKLEVLLIPFQLLTLF